MKKFGIDVSQADKQAVKKRIFLILGLVTSAGIVAVALQKAPVVVPPSPTTQVATPLRATQPATTNVVKPPPGSYLDVVKTANETIRDKELLTIPLDLVDAAHIFLPRSAIICGRGDLWVEEPNIAITAESAKYFKAIFDEQAHLVDRPVSFVWWRPNDRGDWFPWLCVATDDGYTWLTADGERRMPTRYKIDWSRAVFWNDEAVVVPTERGVAIIRVNPSPSVTAVDLIPESTTPTVAPKTKPQFVLDGQGVLAWAPADTPDATGSSVARFIDDKWTTLNPADWPETIVHLIPLVDGTILRLNRVGGKTELSLIPLSAGNVDEATIQKLVDQLSEPDPRDRAAAFGELTRQGPAAWPVLERLAAEQPAEAQLRISQILRDRTKPTLSGMSPIDGRLRVVSRDRNGGVVFYAEKGVTMTDVSGKPATVPAAWITVRPGQAPDLLPFELTKDLRPDRVRFDWFGGTIVITDSTNGPRRYLGRKLIPLLRDSEREFDQIVGVDSRGRWVFKHGDSGTATEPATVPATSSATHANARTLILDPTIPTPAPRLPGWLIENTIAAGWTADDWPAVNVKGKCYKLTAAGWETIEVNKVVTSLSPTNAATQPVKPLLESKDGSKYFGGLTSITRRDKSNVSVDRSLPSDAQGKGPVYLARTEDGFLLLMNSPGRIVRLKLDGNRLKTDGVFTRLVPNGQIRRFWLDPAGRLCIAHDTAGLTVLFPSGVIPPAIRKMMPTEALDATD